MHSTGICIRAYAIGKTRILVTSKNFALEISSILKTKIILPSIPKKIVKFLTGKMSELLIFNQKVSSKKLVNEGFVFSHKELKSALENLLK
jgi:hypothetical protein